TRAAIEVVGALPSAVDPRGFATFGLAGAWILITSAMMQRDGSLPRPLIYIGYISGVLLLLLFAGTLMGVRPIILAAGALESLILNPVWWIWTGVALRQPSASARPIVSTSRPAVG